MSESNSASADPSVHRIRLKGPWEILPPDSSDEQFQRHSMPQDWRTLFGEVAGTAVFRRNFHRPSGLAENDRVIIHIPNGVGDVTNFIINDAPLTPCSQSPLNFDITDQLVDFNQLQFAITFSPLENPALPGGLWETVFLEVHANE